MPRVPRLRSSVLLALATLFAAPAAPSAQPQSEWISLDGSPPGTPAQVAFDNTASSAQASFFDVFIHGFYVTPRMSPTGQPFSEMDFPGLSHGNTPGQPFLPAVQMPLAYPPGATVGTLASVQVVARSPFTPPNPVWPTPIFATDTTSGRPEQFVPPDPTIYQSTSPWPPNNGDGRQVARRKGAFMGGTFRLNPIHWTPSTNLLDVMTHVRYQIAHPGTQGGSTLITKDSWAYAAKAFVNWPLIQTYYPPNGSTWTGDYLIVTQSANAGALFPLITQKASRGYAVTVHLLTASEIGNFAAIRSVIVSWYAGTSLAHDHYALLVGDTPVIPMGSYGGTPTDDLYADADGDGVDDLDEEVFVGRLSCNSFADVKNQITKWMKYENTPSAGFNYGRDLLIGNLQGAPGKYVGCLESVASYGGYVVHPAFTKLYGSVGGNTNATLSADVNAGYGIVTYRGHGDWDEWWNWDLPGESYYSSNVDALSNAVSPVVWSIACSTYELDQEDCFGEHWMAETGDKGAVSFYGASEPSDTDPNHILCRGLHRAVFQYGFTKQARAIASAEAEMYDTTFSMNSWRYGLLGDPDMDVRRVAPYSFLALAPYHIALAAQSSVPIKVMDASGRPVPNVLVGAYKPAGLGSPVSRLGPEAALSTQAAEFFDNHYTDANGNVTLNGAATTPGWLYYSVRFDEGGGQGTAVMDSIPVGAPAGVDGVALGPQSLSATPSLSHGATEFRLGRPMAHDATILVSDVMGRTVRVLRIASGDAGAGWDGRSDQGADVANGIYFARVEEASRRYTARVAMLR